MKRIWLLLLIVILSGCRRTMTPAETFDDVIAYPEYTGKTIIEYTEDESTELVEEYTKYLYVGEDIAEIHEQRYYFKYDSTIENVSESFAEAISNYKTMSKTELEASVNENGFTNVSCVLMKQKILIPLVGMMKHMSLQLFQQIIFPI